MLINAIRRMKRILLPRTMTALDHLQEHNRRLLSRVDDLERQVAEWNHRSADANAQIRAACGNLIRRSSAEAYFDCEFNGVRVMLPRDTLCTMTHCIHASADRPLALWVETAHASWLQDKLRPGDVFLDVGASTGAMTIPIAKTVRDARVIAFEPNRNTRRILIETLDRNRIAGVEVEAFAVTDAVGTTTFVELPQDPTGINPFMPEASSLLTEALSQATIGTSYQANVTTLDAYFANRSDASQVRSVKIDVEGFEVHVLRGAISLLKSAKPYLAIDIHKDPFGPGSTEAGCLAVLTPLGFSFDKQGHVLLCVPAA